MQLRELDAKLQLKPGKTHLHRKMAIRNRLMLMTKFPVCSYNRKKAKVLTRDLVPDIVDSGPMCITDCFQNR